MKTIVPFILAALLPTSISAQRYESLVLGNCNNSSSQLQTPSVAVNSVGDVFAFGEFTDQLIVGGDTINTSGGDLYLVHLNALGEYIGVKHFGTTGNSDSGSSVAIDSEDNIYLAWYSGIASNYVDEDTTVATPFNNHAVLCLDSSMHFNWLATFVGANMMVAASDEGPGVYITDGDKVFHYNEEGDQIWQKQSAGMYLKSIAVNNDRIAITGTIGFVYSASIDTVAVDVEYLNSAAVFEMDTTGSALWGHEIGSYNGNYAEVPRRVAIEPVTHDVYVLMGVCMGPFDFAGETLMNPLSVGLGFVPLLKYDSEGNEMWSSLIYSTVSGIGVFAMNVTDNGDVLVGGSLYSADVYFGDEVYDLGGGGVVGWLAKVDSEGNEQWVKADPRHGYETGVCTETHDVAGLPDGSYVSVSTFYNSGSGQFVYTGCYNEAILSEGFFVNRINDEVEHTPNTNFEMVMSGDLFTSEFPHQEAEQLNGLYGAWNFGDGNPWLYQDDVFHVFEEPGVYNVCLSMSNSCGSSQHCAYATYPGLREIQPYIGGQGGVTSAIILGGGFVDGTTFKLQRDGESDIVPSLITFGNTATVFGRLDLLEAALGEWNVIADIPGIGTDTLFNAFIVEEHRPAEMEVQILGTNKSRPNQWLPNTIRVSNTGNEDAVLVPLHFEMPIGIEMWWFASAMDRHSVPGNEDMNEALDMVGDNYDVMVMEDPIYQITEVNMTLPFVGSNSYIDIPIATMTEVDAYVQAVVYPPLISSLAMIDNTILPYPSTHLYEMIESSSWYYKQEFVFDDILASFNQIIQNYAWQVAQIPGGTGGWHFNDMIPTLPDIGGIGNVQFTPVLDPPSGYSSTPIWIGPPLIGTTGPGSSPPFNPPQPPPPIGLPPPPPPVLPPPPLCAYNGCCSPGCTTPILTDEEWPYHETEEAPILSDDEDGDGVPAPVAPPRPDNDSDAQGTETPSPEPIPCNDPDDPWDCTGCTFCPTPGSGGGGGGNNQGNGGSGVVSASDGGESGDEICTGCMGGMGGGWGTGTAGAAAADIFDKIWNRLWAIDPNAIYGPQHMGDIYLATMRDHSYTITFENLAEATAPAQTVIVTDTLDTTKFDVHSFRFINASIGDSLTINLEPEVYSANYMVDLNPIMDLYLNLTAQFDTLTGIIRWEFNSIDPATNALTQDPEAGFLPPNTEQNKGVGSLSYMVSFLQPMEAGDTVATRASIVFDTNEEIFTNEHLNVMDFQAPESAVDELPAYMPEDTLFIHITGSDDVSGIAYYHVFVSINNHIFKHYRTINGNTFPFIGTLGYSYRFFSVAVDKAGNVEGWPEDYVNDPDASTTIGVGITENEQLHSIVVYPNPAEDFLITELMLNKEAEIRVQCLDALGRKVGINEKLEEPTKLPHGPHRFVLDVSGWSAGMYSLQVFVDDQVVTRRFVKK